MRLYEKLCQQILLARQLDANGSFCYLRKGKPHTIQFNGRNAQFHALYEYQYRHGYELETGLLLSRLCRGNKIFYDIGTNWGYFSLLVAASPEFSGTCYAFEPNPPTFRDLESVITQAGLGEIIKAFQLGIGSELGELQVEQSDRFLSGLAKLSSQGRGPTVPVKPLDALGLPAPDVVKIDAEGMELSILRGAERLLATTQPLFVFENFLNHVHPSETIAPIAFLISHGYSVFNPTLEFHVGDCQVLASYGDYVSELLATDPDPMTCLVPVTPKNRFLMRQQLNLFACHRDRLPKILADKIRLTAGA